MFQFVWLKDNQPLAASTRLRTRYDIGTKQVLLQINDVRPQDVGEYRVVAKNPAGEDSTKCAVNVVPDKPGVDDRGFIPNDKFRNLERPEGQGRRPLEIVPGVDIQPFIAPERFSNLQPIPSVTKPEDELKEPKRAPKVIVPLADCSMEEQMPIIFVTTIDAGVPMATVSIDSSLQGNQSSEIFPIHVSFRLWLFEYLGANIVTVDVLIVMTLQVT